MMRSVLSVQKLTRPGSNPTGSRPGIAMTLMNLLLMLCLPVGVAEMLPECQKTIRNFALQTCQTRPFSCLNRCGTFANLMETDFQTTPYPPCACDERCLVYHDCCWDFQLRCSEMAEIGSLRFKHLLNLEIKCDGSDYVTYISECLPDYNEFTTQDMAPSSTPIKNNTRSFDDIDWNTFPTVSPMTSTPTYAASKVMRTLKPESVPRRSAKLKSYHNPSARTNQPSFKRPHGANAGIPYGLRSIHILRPVLDMTYGIIFESEDAYNCHAQRDSTIFIYPLITSYTEGVIPNEALNSPFLAKDSNISQYFRICRKRQKIMCNVCKSVISYRKLCSVLNATGDVSASLLSNLTKVENLEKVDSQPMCTGFSTNYTKPTTASLSGHEENVIMWKVQNTRSTYLIQSDRHSWTWQMCDESEKWCTTLHCALYLALSRHGGQCRSPERMISFLAPQRDVGWMYESQITIDKKSFDDLVNSTPACVCYLMLNSVLQLNTVEAYAPDMNNLCDISLRLPVNNAATSLNLGERTDIFTTAKMLNPQDIKQSGHRITLLDHLEKYLLQNVLRESPNEGGSCLSNFPTIYGCVDFGSPLSGTDDSSDPRIEEFGQGQNRYKIMTLEGKGRFTQLVCLVVPTSMNTAFPLSVSSMMLTTSTFASTYIHGLPSYTM